MAYALGFPSDTAFLRSISRTQWLRWRAWRRIRGPVGPHRDTALFAYLGMRMAATVQKDVSFKDYLDEAAWFLEAADQPPSDNDE